MERRERRSMGNSHEDVEARLAFDTDVRGMSHAVDTG
jgi:hypothetical protein